MSENTVELPPDLVVQPLVSGQKFHSAIFNFYASTASGPNEIERRAQSLPLPRRLARYVVARAIQGENISLADLTEGDPRHPASIKHDANPTAKEQTLRFYQRSISNFGEATDKLADYWDSHNLFEAPGVVVMTPHIRGLSDLAIAAALTVNPDMSGRSISSPENNHMLLGRLIAHTSVDVGLVHYLPEPIKSYFRLSGRRIIRPFEMARSTTNIAQVIPDSESTANLRSEHGEEIERSNRAGGREGLRWIKSKDGRLVFLAPGGSRCRELDDTILIPQIPSSMDSFFQSIAKNGLPIVTMGLYLREEIIYLSQIAGMGKFLRQHMAVDIAEPIWPNSTSSDIRSAVYEKLKEVTENTSGKTAKVAD